MTQTQRQVATILSCNFSGSHFLSLMLGSHSSAQHIGELRSRRRTYSRPRTPCHLCENLEQCPIVRGITPETIGRVYDIVFDNFDDPSITTLIDASKKVDWAERFVESSPYRMKYIHLIRDPRALVRRWILKYQDSTKDRVHERLKAARHLPGKAAGLLAGPQWKVYLYRWLDENQQITRFLAQHRLDHVLVTYQEAALQPEVSLRRIMKWLELDAEPGQTSYWEFPHHGTQKHEYEWVKEKKERYFDQRWRDFLSQSVQEEIPSNRDVRQYLDSQQLMLADDGLHRAD